MRVWRVPGQIQRARPCAVTVSSVDDKSEIYKPPPQKKARHGLFDVLTAVNFRPIYQIVGPYLIGVACPSLCRLSSPAERKEKHLSPSLSLAPASFSHLSSLPSPAPASPPTHSHSLSLSVPLLFLSSLLNPSLSSPHCYFRATLSSDLICVSSQHYSKKVFFKECMAKARHAMYASLISPADIVLTCLNPDSADRPLLRGHSQRNNAHNNSYQDSSRQPACPPVAALERPSL